jgi:hypothetical protein
VFAGSAQREEDMETKLLRKITVGASVVVLLFAFKSVTLSQNLDDVPSFRCDGETVSVGDRQNAVKQACGNPKKINVSSGGSVEEWVYNFGPTKFIHYVTLVNGRLERIQAGEYGFEK